MCNKLNSTKTGGEEDRGVGYKLRDMRQAKQLTQQQLAEKSGVSRQTINNIENDEHYNTTFNTLVKLADALGVTVDQIFFDQSAQ